LDNAEAKIAAVQDIKNVCKQVSADEKNRILDDLIAEAGVVPSASHAANYQTMSWDELRSMATNPLFTIGGHSLYHDVLSAQPSERMRDDIELTLRLLSHNLHLPIRHFSYPEGQPRHYTEAAIGHLKSLGVICSPSALCGLNARGADLFPCVGLWSGSSACRFRSPKTDRPSAGS
jgi:hypothetical protein